MRTINHGTKSGYSQGCRKPCCRKANADYMREYRKANPRPARAAAESNARRAKRAGLPTDWTWW